MNKIITFLVLLIAFQMHCLAQNYNSNIPINEYGKYSYKEVVELDSLFKKDNLYFAAREWFAKSFNSAQHVIQMEERDAGKLIGKGNFSVNHKILNGEYPSGTIDFTVIIEVKDGRYRYEFTDFYHKGNVHLEDGGACESMYSKAKWRQKMFDYYIVQIAEIVPKFIEELKNSILKNTSSVDKW